MAGLAVQKHGIDFVEAIGVLQDPLAVTNLDRWHLLPREVRFNVVGMSRSGKLLHVTVAERGSTIRIISARRATARERHDDEEG